MFSYKINNPNNFSIDVKGDYYAIPFGHRCSSALACKYAHMRKFSLPFDWTIPLYPSKIQKVLENDFEDYIPDVRNNVFVNKYDFELAHFNEDIDAGIEEYTRRIERFRDIIQHPKKKYFVYINEDYFYDEKYRQNDFNDNIFNEMLELEKFIRNKYANIDYNILYFNFIEHNIPADSNIINIVLNSTEVYNYSKASPYEDFRNFCGKILSELFNTDLLPGYDISVFNN
jgi:hypothetical protein